MPGATAPAMPLKGDSATAGRSASGEGGIRTLEAGIPPPNALAGRRLQPLGHFSERGTAYRTSFRHRDRVAERLPLPAGRTAPWRGGRAVECGGLENRFGRFRPTRVQIPPPPLLKPNPASQARFGIRAGVFASPPETAGDRPGLALTGAQLARSGAVAHLFGCSTVVQVPVNGGPGRHARLGPKIPPWPKVSRAKNSSSGSRRSRTRPGSGRRCAIRERSSLSSRSRSTNTTASEPRTPFRNSSDSGSGRRRTPSPPPSAPPCITTQTLSTRSKLRRRRSRSTSSGEGWRSSVRYGCSDLLTPFADKIEEQLREEERRWELRLMPYDEYLQTPEWQEKRAEARARADGRCQICNSLGPLDVHHRSYQRRGGERQDDLIVLCRDCHELFHRFGRLQSRAD
jgi:5-methylcytosine-specific restriction endonuclease McrA